MDMKNLARLSHEAYFNGSHTFSEDGATANDALRNLIKETLGGEYSYNAWGQHKYEVFQILETALDAVMPEYLKNQLDQFADFRQVSLGDKPLFRVNDPRGLRVGRLAAGANDMRRQTINSKTFTIPTEWFGTKVYAEYEQYMAGDINWQELVNRVAQGFVTHIEQQIADGLQKSYSALDSAYHLSGSVTIDAIVELAQKVQAKSGGRPVAIYGTKAALAKVANLAGVNMFSGDMKNQFNENGYLGMVRGLELRELPQAFKANTDEFALDDKKVIVLPQNEKIVGVVTEGNTEVYDTTQEDNTSLQLAFGTRRKLGVGVLQFKVFGMAELA